MNFKTTFYTALAATLLLTACKKTDNNLLSTNDGLAGAWKLSLQGSDQNNNSKFDVEEKYNIADSSVFTYQFAKTGGGYQIGNNSSYVDTLNWLLIDNDQTLQLSVYNNSFVKKYYYHYEYNASTLLLIDTTVKPFYFRSFERQN